MRASEIWNLANHRWAGRYVRLLVVGAALALLVLTGCGGIGQSPTPTPAPQAEELIFYDWSGDLIETLFDDFEEEFGVKVTYVVYETPEEAVDIIGRELPNHTGST